MSDSAALAVQLHGGPLDGQTVLVDLDAEPWTEVTSSHGGRSLYAPDEAGVWRWVRDIPWEAM
ncbi:hypothetical protein [Streptomyces sp. 35G-GA-8]|uniref:hypothetical protein n=1 Tax=Streptomyces sp. 35G-GA-8 TaxID=2939434 RepID=UPI00201F1955|nr:hypothetical protein [Streptomyces sp. 35G-GA-8]MCL7377464.1 hypothetical protein [Streptomyces sp. 35G-GA-8]